MPFPCQRCGLENASEHPIYPYGYRSKKSNRVILCLNCLGILRECQRQRRQMHSEAERDWYCLCCPPEKERYENLCKRLQEFAMIPKWKVPPSEAQLRWL